MARYSELMKTCNRCGLPETYETIEFDTKGICNICRQNEFKRDSINWNERKQMLNQIIEKHRGIYDYDCIIPFSGGKDSTFTLLYLIEEFGIKPLVIQFNHGFMRPNLLNNNVKTLKKLGADFLSFTPNWKIVKLLMFESLVRKGDFCWHCHTGIFSYPMHIAVKFNIPLVIWGEPSSEYTAYYDYRDDKIENVNEVRFNRYVNLGITSKDMEGMLKQNHELDKRDLQPYSYPSIDSLKQIDYQSICLGSFIPWDAKSQSKRIIDELGWSGDQVEGMPPGMYNYEKIECYMQGVRDYIKYLKRGYSRVTQMTALDLRNDRISKDVAEKLIRDYEGRRPPSLDIFLDYLQIDEEEFNSIIKRMVIYPNSPDFDNIEKAPNTHDNELWYRES